MEEHLLQINVSNSKYIKKDDLIKIKFQNEEDIQINFTNFFIQSKYLLDKYKYSEGLDLIQNELEEMEKEFDIKELSIKFFLKLFQEEKVNIPIEHYKDIYTLSEQFNIPKFIKELDNINETKLFQDLNFTIQILQDSYRRNDNIETKLNNKIENFLISRINECISNSKFNELPNSTIYRILEQSKEMLDHNLLIEFILESSNTRFIFFKFIELDKLTKDKINKFIKFIYEQDDETQKIYLDYMKFNLSFIQNILNKHDQIFNELNETKQELNETKQELNETKQELNETKEELNKSKQELNETKQELNEIKEELNKSKEELNETKQELNETKEELNKSKEELNETKDELNKTIEEFNQRKEEFNPIKRELNQCKSELKQFEDEINRKQIEKKQCKQIIIVGGDDRYNALGENPNNKTKNGKPIISPSVVLSFDHSSLLSYSIYCIHSVLVMSDGSLKGIGNNNDGRISATLQKTDIDHFTDFCIKDSSGRQLTAVSAVCCVYSTLYMFSKSNGNERQLVLCDCDINGGDPVFLDIGNHQPVSLFGGCSHSACICREGEIIFINRNSIKKSPKSPITAVSLPDGEKASSIACCESLVVVLSSNGRVFISPIESNEVLKFSIAEELSDQEIVAVSGVFEHILAVNKEGRVFGRGSNEDGQLGLDEGTKSVSSFREISSLLGYEIRAAYAGWCHSLFETREGKILSCGFNYFGQLLLSSVPGGRIYSPTKTIISDGATFCIAGSAFSVIFIGNDPPPNMPNTRIHQHQ